LKIEKQTLEDHQVKLVVEVEPEPFEDAKHRAARKLAKKVKIPGFRPGKAPYPVIVRHIGEGTITEEAIEILVNDIYPEAIQQAEIEPYSLGSLENISSLDPPTFEFVIPLKAQVELGDYKEIRLPYEPPEIQETDVDEVLENLRERQAVIEPVDQPAQEANLVQIHFEGVRAEPADGESPTLISDREYPVVIEPEQVDTPVSEWPYPGFSRQLIGLSAGDKKEIEYTFPEDTEYESLKGVKAIFNINVEQVNLRSLPELDDEFALSVGDYSNIEELRAAIRQDLENQSEQTYDEGYDEELIEEIVSISSMKYPPQMLEQEIDTVINRLENNLSMQRLDLDLYLKSRQMEMDDLREELKPVAESRLKKSLVLFELADAENIQIEPDELQSATNRTLGELSSRMQDKDFRKIIQTDEARSNLVGNVMMDLLIERTQKRLREIARGMVAEEAIEPEIESVEVESTGANITDSRETEDAVMVDEISTEETAAVSLAEDIPEAGDSTKGDT
jgi:trigger factor